MEWKAYLTEIDEAYALPPKEAEARLLQLDSACRQEYGKDSYTAAAMDNELGAFYKGQGRFEEAAACFRRALKLFEASARPGDPACATATNNLAGVLRLQGRTAEAEQAFDLALTLYEKTVGTGHVLYAAALNNRSLVALDRDDLQRAAALQAQAITILRALPACRDELAAALVNLGALYQKAGKAADAEPLLEEALRMFESELGTDTPHYHAALNGRGVLRYRNGDFAGAEADFLAAARAAEVMYGANHYEAQGARANAQAARRAMEGAERERS